MGTDWKVWHEAYDDPASSLSRRLDCVRGELRRLLIELEGRPVQLVAMCAGDGRDTLPVLAELHPDARALLVELDDDLAERARAEARDLGLTRVRVLGADAGDPASYSGLPPADVVMATGVFGNISDDDVERTVRGMRSLLAPGGRVVWTRGHRVDEDPTHQVGDPSLWVREVLSDQGYVEERFVRPADASYRVGVHRWPEATAAASGDDRWFSFLR